MHSPGANPTFFKNLSTKLNKLDMQTCADESSYLKLQKLLDAFSRRLEAKSQGAELKLVSVGSFTTGTLRSYKLTVDCVFQAKASEHSADSARFSNDRFKLLIDECTGFWQGRALTQTEQQLNEEFSLNLSPVKEEKLVHRLCFQEEDYWRSIIGTQDDEELKIKIYFMNPRELSPQPGSPYKLNKIDAGILHSEWFRHAFSPSEESAHTKPFAAMRLLKIWK